MAAIETTSTNTAVHGSALLQVRTSSSSKHYARQTSTPEEAETMLLVGGHVLLNGLAIGDSAVTWLSASCLLVGFISK